MGYGIESKSLGGITVKRAMKLLMVVNALYSSIGLSPARSSLSLHDSVGLRKCVTKEVVGLLIKMGYLVQSLELIEQFDH